MTEPICFLNKTNRLTYFVRENVFDVRFSCAYVRWNARDLCFTEHPEFLESAYTFRSNLDFLIACVHFPTLILSNFIVLNLNLHDFSSHSWDLAL